eukprot:787292-Pyramimonas_sp.AAC.1
MTDASKLSPKVRVALQFLARIYFVIENAVAVRLFKGSHRLPAVAHADSDALVRYDSDVAPGFFNYESRMQGTPPAVQEKSEANLEADALETRHAELQGERGLLETATLEPPCVAFTMTAFDKTVLRAAAEDDPGTRHRGGAHYHSADVR